MITPKLGLTFVKFRFVTELKLLKISEKLVATEFETTIFDANEYVMGVVLLSFVRVHKASVNIVK